MREFVGFWLWFMALFLLLAFATHPDQFAREAGQIVHDFRAAADGR